MIEEKFSPFYLCNFNDCIKKEDLPNEYLKTIWSCQIEIDEIEEIIKNYLIELDYDDVNDENTIQSCLQLSLIFVQYNFTGPFSQLDEYQRCLESTLPAEFNAASRLIVNGEEINSNVKLPELLVIAKDLIKRLELKYPNSIVIKWWKHRLTCIHQKILDEMTISLYEELKATSEFLMEKVNCLQNDELEAVLYLEVANGYLLFHRTQKSGETLEELCARLQVVLNIESLLGMRTKFQEKPLPQLCLKVEQNDPSIFPTSSMTHGSTSIPKLLKLDDDTRLEKIQFVAPEDNVMMSLSSIMQALVLAKVKQIKRSQPQDHLGDEQLEPYITTLLHQDHGPLQVRQSALLLNVTQECNARRTVERSWKQCEEAISLLNGTKYSIQERLSYAFAAFMIPKWEVQSQLCDLMLSLGMTKSALDIYLQIKAWPKVIECYNRLELRHKAAEIIRQELDKKPTALLYCLLGDATDDVSCYETAWNFSKNTSGRAQAHWGQYFYQRKEYEAAIPHLQKSVEINSLQEKQWLRLGYAAIMLEKWELAVHAYITYTHLEPYGFESWNNLAKALIKLGDKKRAHRVLGEALKCNHNNWKVWENFMLVSIDTGHFEDVLNAYNRLSELKERFLDFEVLSIVISAIAVNKPDAEGRSSQRLGKKAISLLGHQCIKHPSDGRLWELAAMIASSPLNKALKLQKAYRSFSQKDLSWSSKQPSAIKLLQLCREICENSLEAVSNHDPSEKSSVVSQISSARLTAQSCTKAVEKNLEVSGEIETLLAEIKKLLESLCEAQEKMNERRQ